MAVRIGRVYDDPSPDDGMRVLVDRLWPRGMSKQSARIDLWDKEVAPSTELRQWYGHDPAKTDEFSRRYREELRSEPAARALADLVALAREQDIVLLTASKAVDLSQAHVLRELISRALG